MNRGTKKHSIVQQVNRSGSLKIISGISNARQNKDVYFDFINVENTKSKCQEKGLLFSDTSSLFIPSWTLDAATRTFNGTWANVAGEGWLPTIAGVNYNSAGFMIIIKQSDFIVTLEIKYAPTNVNERIVINANVLTETNHASAVSSIYDTSIAASQLICGLYSNDGDDTLTARYTGAVLAGAGVRTYKLKHQNGCISLWDEQDDAWHDYEGHSASKSYAVKYLLVSVRVLDANIPPLYYRSLRIQYL